MALYRAVLVWCLRAAGAAILLLAIYNGAQALTVDTTGPWGRGAWTPLEAAVSALLPAGAIGVATLAFAETLALLCKKKSEQ